MSNTLYRLAILAAVAALLSACGTLTDPAALAAPKQARQFNLDERLATQQVRGLLNIKWEFGLLPGRYAAVHEDTHGVYFRGPTGAVFARIEGNDAQYNNGGVWMPHEANLKPKFYIYQDFINHKPSSPEPGNRPLTVAEGAAAGAVGGAIGGAAGGATAHAVRPSMGGSYGQAAATGAGAGLVAGAIIGAIIAADAGKIAMWEDIPDEKMVVRLRQLAQGAGPMAQPPQPTPTAVAPEVQPASPPVTAANGVTTTPIAPPPILQQLPSANAAAPTVKRQGVWSYEAKALAAAQGCKTDKAAWLLGEYRYGVSRYYVDCGDGRAVVVACDSLACKLEPF